MKDDLWFSPGDKVMLVSSAPRSEVLKCDVAIPQYGVVYCVEDFWEGPQFNVIMLVGFGGWRHHNGMKVGWDACSFRKLEEIKLIMRAVQPERIPC